MQKFRWHKWIRKTHRYLGLLIGIQFLMWTIGGLYFSFIDLDTVHGTDRLRPTPELSDSYQLTSLDALRLGLEDKNPARIDRIDLLVLSEEQAIYRVSYRNSEGEREAQLFDASSGAARESLTEKEAAELATLRYDGEAKMISTRLLESTGPHDEYRELPLPAYAFTFDDKRKTTLYVAPEQARLTSVRNNQWRIFDFLWMMHTMDYEGRDNFNTRLLQAFAVFGLMTLLSGFALFFVSSKVFKYAKR